MHRAWVIALSLLTYSFSAYATPAAQSSKPSVAQYQSPEAILKAYLRVLKDRDYKGFKRLQAHETLEPSEDSGRLIALEKEFKERLSGLPKDLNWDKHEVLRQSECTSATAWRCTLEVALASEVSSVKILVSLLKLDQSYFLDQAKAHLKVTVFESPTLLQGDHDGEALFKAHRCNACHSTQEGVRMVGPSLFKIFGSRLSAQTGEVKLVDEAHLRSSILNPNDFQVKGFPPAMPSYQRQLNKEELDALVEYLKTL